MNFNVSELREELFATADMSGWPRSELYLACATALKQQAAEIARMAAEIKILRESLVQVLDHFLNGDHSRVLDLANAALNFSPPATAAKPNSPDTPTQPDEIPLRSTDRS